jgi:hypothetical protein
MKLELSTKKQITNSKNSFSTEFGFCFLVLNLTYCSNILIVS